MKKLDKLVLGAFLSPFLLTFLVVVFILLNIQMLKYFDDLIGKGLELALIAQLLFYFAIFTTPTALPLSVLLSSLIAFGNLGEHFELTAIKSSGVSLVRTLRPIFFFVLLLTGVAFYANNTLVPYAALEAYSLLYDIKQKKPALDLREGSFYNGISDISIKVDKKYPDGITLKDVVVYDHRKNDGNKEVTVADSGKMYTILNERYLKFELFNGYNYTEGASSEAQMTGKTKTTETLSRSKFAKSQVVFDLSSFQLERTDKKWFQGNRIMRNLRQLEGDMDSLNREVLGQRLNHYQYKHSYFTYFDRDNPLTLPPDVEYYKQYRDSMASLPYRDKMSPPTESVTDPVKKPKEKLQPNVKPRSPKPNAALKEKRSSRLQAKDDGVKNEVAKVPLSPQSSTELPDASQADTLAVKKINRDSLIVAKKDSIFDMKPGKDNYQSATNSARQIKSQLMNVNASMDNYTKEFITFNVQWHKIIASSLACIAMFLIGAPLGAIIKKGGLGMPFLVSILFFIVYYVLTLQGEKLAKQETISVTAGVWLADCVLLVIGLFFLRQARADARLFEADFYSVVYDKVKRWLKAHRK